MQKFKNALKSIHVEHIDVIAEAVVADLLEQGIDITDIEVYHDGAFERNYKKDLTDISVDMVRKAISLHITRNSLYDNLPEGLFHPLTRYSGLDPDVRKKEFNKQKKEEEKARKFFRPFDKEFLLQKVKLEIETRKLIEDPVAEIEKWFPNEENIPGKYFRRLVKFLPFTNMIKGNMDLTACCLSEILGENVTAGSFYSTITAFQSSSNEQNRLGAQYLGENLICGNSLNESILVWEFTVVVNNEKMLGHYVDVDKGFMNKLINQFYQYFVPLEIKINTKISCSTQNAFYLKEDREFTKSNTDRSLKDIYLGYNVML